MRKTRMQKGITLIALIITIIILLILAVVAIGAIQESNIILHTKNASTGYNDEKAKEESAIAGYETLIESKLPRENGGSGNQDGEDSPSEEEPEFVEYTLWTEAKTSNQTFAEETTGSSINPIIPAGFIPKNTKTSKWDAEGGPQWDNGLVIVDASGNEFVWVPVTETIAAYGLNAGEHREPDVVTYAYPSETVDSASGTKYDAVTSNLNRAGCTKDLTGDGNVDAYDFKKQLENEFNLMATSINEYDGFYVGRYETSMNGINPQSKASTLEETITSATAATESAYAWYGLYALNKKFTTSSVQGSMMWGSQYDAMMAWMGDEANTPGGNKRNTNRTCGTAPNDVIKNVYDLYGNSYEWTLEANGTSFRVYYGRFFQKR